MSVYTVAKEVGHGGETMVRRVYGHLGQVRHRAEMVEYRVDQHRDRLAETLKTLAPYETLASCLGIGSVNGLRARDKPPPHV